MWHANTLWLEDLEPLRGRVQIYLSECDEYVPVDRIMAGVADFNR